MIELDGDGLTMDVGKLVGTCALIQGTRGAGKSYLVRVVSEGTIPEVQTIILDPEGDFATLRERFDILIAGKNGDVPCDVRSARLLARRVAELGASTVVDMSTLLPAEKHEFVAGFVDQLNTLPEALERSRLLVLDEAHLFCPESGKNTSVAKNAVVMLMSQGRKRGLGAVLVTQRLAKLNNDAASECGNIFICRSSPIDLARAQELLGFDAKDRRALQETPDGFFYARGVALSQKKSVVQFQCRQALTTHPEPGTRHRSPPPPPKTNAIKKLLAELRDIPAASVEDVASLEDAKKRIRILEAELAKPREMAVDVKALEREYMRGATEKDREWRDFWHRLNDEMRKFPENPTDRKPKAKAKAKAKAAVVVGVDRGVDDGDLTVEVTARRRADGSTEILDVRESNHFVGKAWDMLRAVAFHGELTKRQLGIIVGISSESGTFKKYMSAGNTLGYWEGRHGSVKITEAGRNAAGPVKRMPKGAALLDMWCQHEAITGKAKDMLRTVVAAGPDGLTPAEWGKRVGISHTSGTFKKYASVLRTLGVVAGYKRVVGAEGLRDR